jgi:hypothetical protein
MTFDDDIIARAFKQHHDRYADGAAWDIPYHIEMWQRARKAFDEDSYPDFEWLYEELRRRWQVFRGGRSPWSTKKLFERLTACDRRFSTVRLSELEEKDLDGLWALLQAMKDVKVTAEGPSVVAVSKFLHFWNPRLFVIVDYGVVWSHVLRHWWLWDDFVAVRTKVDERVQHGAVHHPDRTCDLASYLAVLQWASGLVRRHPRIAATFAAYVQQYANGAQLPPDLPTYEAAAVEWFLLGVVELPPVGVAVLGA